VPIAPANWLISNDYDNYSQIENCNEPEESPGARFPSVRLAFAAEFLHSTRLSSRISQNENARFSVQ